MKNYDTLGQLETKIAEPFGEKRPKPDVHPVVHLKSSERLALETALVRQPKGTMQAIANRLGKYRSLLEASRFLFLLAAQPGDIKQPESPEIRVSEAAEIVHRMLSEENEKATEENLTVEQQDKRSKEFKEEIDAGNFDQATTVKLTDIIPFLLHENVPLKHAVELIQDSGAYEEAFLGSYRYGTAKQKADIKSYLTGWLEAEAMSMNLKKGQPDRFDYADASTDHRLYAMLALAGDDMRPSTAGTTIEGEQYVGVFDRLLIKMIQNETTATALLKDVDYIEYRSFFSTASTYDRIDEFLSKTKTPEERSALITRFVEGLEKDGSSKEISAVAQVVIHEKDSPIGQDVQKHIRSSYEQAVLNHDAKAEIIYGHLSSLYGDQADTWLGDRRDSFTLEVHEQLPLSKLIDEQGNNTQLHYFYNDEDGEHWYQEFLSDHDDWVKIDHATWVELSKVSDDGTRIITMYANHPESAPGKTEGWEEKNGNGITDILKDLERREKKPAIAMHHGHSYWSQYTINRLPTESALYIDGSCNGADNLDQVFELAPQIQIVYNSHEGMGTINNAISDVINDQILSGRDLTWSTVREQTHSTIQESTGWKTWVTDYFSDRNTDAVLDDRMSDYVFPDMAESAGVTLGLVVEQQLVRVAVSP